MILQDSLFMLVEARDSYTIVDSYMTLLMRMKHSKEKQLLSRIKLLIFPPNTRCLRITAREFFPIPNPLQFSFRVDKPSCIRI